MAEKITVEEYNRQKDEYTQQALRELRDQMKYHPQSSSRILENQKYDNDCDNDSDNSNDSNDSDSSVIIHNSNSDSNLIIKHITNKTNTNNTNTNKIDKISNNRENILTNRKKYNLQRMKSNADNENDSTKSLNEVIYAQRELDMKTIQSLKEMINKIRNELDDECKKNYYLKLDLNNSNCDNSDLKKQNQVLKEENDANKKVILEYKNKTYRDGINILVMKIMIGLLMFLVFVW